MLMLIWTNISRRRVQWVLTVTITLLTVMVFVMVLGVFQTMNKGLELSRERMGADAVLLPKYAAIEGTDLLFTAFPENVYMPAEVLEQAKALDVVAAMSPQFYAQTLSLACCEPGEEARIIGLDAETDFILSPYLGEELEGLQDDQMIMGGNFDKSYVGGNYLALGRKFFVTHRLQPTGTGMDSTIFMNIDVVRDLCLESQVLSADWEGKDPHAA